MAKRTAGLDPAHQIGQTTPPSDILIADEGAHRRGLKIAILKMFLDVEEESIEIWQIGDRHSIQRVK